MYEIKRITAAGTSGYSTVGVVSLTIRKVRKQDAPIMVPFPSIIMIHPTIAAALNLPQCLRINQNVVQAAEQKLVLLRAI
jgi:hypothetical protein